jgi:hypothetical protein
MSRRLRREVSDEFLEAGIVTKLNRGAVESSFHKNPMGRSEWIALALDGPRQRLHLPRCNRAARKRQAAIKITISCSATCAIRL